MNLLCSTRSLFIVLSFSFTILISSSTVFACDCSGPTGKNAIVRKSSVAFRGVVTNIEYLDVKTGSVEPRIIVTFFVSRVWAGNVKKTFFLHTTENSWTCSGYYFIKDREYLVVAYPNGEQAAKRFNDAKNTFGTDPCGSTLPIERAKGELAELGKGVKPKR